jgi:hypothetical protein
MNSAIARQSCVGVLCLIGIVAAATDRVAYTTIASGAHSGIDDRREVVVRSAAEWAALWKEHAAGQPAPSVDFARSIVVGLFLGSRPTGGHAVEIRGVERNDRTLTVTYRERRPDPSSIVTQVMTAPFHLVRVDRHDGEVRFTRVSDGR